MSVPTEARGELIERASRMPAAELRDLLAPVGGVLVVAPHPDDETLGCGAALAAALEAGRTVAVVLLTDGEMSHPRSKRFAMGALVALRRAELEAALATLAGSSPANMPSVRALNLPDGRVPASGPEAERAAGEIAAVARSVGARTIWCTWRGDPHCDHVAAASLCDLAAAKLAADGHEPLLRRDYAVWGRFGAALPGGERLHAFHPGDHAAAKAAAMASYASQLTPLIDDDPDGFVMPPTLVRHFTTAPEIFIEEDRR